MEYTTNNNNNININSSSSNLSFIFSRKEKDKNYDICSVSRNKKFKNNLEENKNSNSKLLSMSFSLKDFRNHLKNNKSLFNFDNNLTKIEETRNTTSIIGFNNSNLIYSKRINNKEKQNSKSTKYIITKNRESKKLSSKNSSSKMITYINSNVIKEKVFPKYNLHRYIYKHYNSRPKYNLSKSKNNSYLALTKKTFRNSQKCFSNLYNVTKLYIKPNKESENNSKSNYLII